MTKRPVVVIHDDSPFFSLIRELALLFAVRSEGKMIHNGVDVVIV
jgi:hypothetical protein